RENLQKQASLASFSALLTPLIANAPLMNAAAIKVLLIEDIPKYARLMRDMLEDYRATAFQLEWVDSMESAVQRIGDMAPDVLLLDLAVAVTHGTESVHQLQHAAPHLPIIILSSLDDE